MADDVTTRQARIFLAALSDCYADITSKLAMVEQRLEARPLSPNAVERNRRHGLRRELHEVNRLIDGLNRRFPELLVPRAG